MKKDFKTEHSADTFFSIFLFGLYCLLLLLFLLFAAKFYQHSLDGLEENQNLHTAMTYVTTKIRQHTGTSSVSLTTWNELPVLCFKDEIDTQIYHTYIYLYNEELKELFTTSNASVSPENGTTIAHLHSFSISETNTGCLLFKMEDPNGNTSELLLNPSVPISSGKEIVS